MKMSITKEYADYITSNRWLREKVKEMDGLSQETTDKFLKENPDFLQTMLHMAMSDQIKVELDEKN
jgi:hypothetical protein